MMLDAFILLDYFPKDHPLEGRQLYASEIELYAL